jgi:hypothetical protein
MREEQGLFILDRESAIHEMTRNNTNKRHEFREVSCHFVDSFACPVRKPAVKNGE